MNHKDHKKEQEEIERQRIRESFEGKDLDELKEILQDICLNVMSAGINNVKVLKNNLHYQELKKKIYGK